MRYAVMNTPLGEITLASIGDGLASILFGGHVPQGGFAKLEGNCVFIQEILEYFHGVRTEFDFPVHLDTTAFQVAAPAVGMANHENRIPIAIPCHRVVGRDGSLTGYAGAIHIKQQLLTLKTRTRSL